MAARRWGEGLGSDRWKLRTEQSHGHTDPHGVRGWPHPSASLAPLCDSTTLRSKMAGNSTANAKLPASPQQSFLPSELQGTGTRSLTCVYCPDVATWRVLEESYNPGVAEVKGAARTPVKPSGSLLAAPPFSLHHCPAL